VSRPHGAAPPAAGTQRPGDAVRRAAALPVRRERLSCSGVPHKHRLHPGLRARGAECRHPAVQGVVAAFAKRCNNGVGFVCLLITYEEKGLTAVFSLSSLLGKASPEVAVGVYGVL